MICRSALAAALGFFLSAQSAPEQLPAGTDGHHPAPLTEGAYRFQCGGGSAELRWREERFDPDAVPRLRDALRVTLLDFSANGRRLSEPDLARIRTLFATFAWVERTISVCYDRDIEVWLTVMPASDWVAFIQEDQEDRPRTRLHTVRISSTGSVSIDGPGH